MKKNVLLIAIFMIARLGFQSCSTENDKVITTSRLQLKLVDSPGDYQEVNVEIVDVLYNYSENEEGWTSITPEGFTPIITDLTKAIPTKKRKQLYFKHLNSNKQYDHERVREFSQKSQQAYNSQNQNNFNTLTYFRPKTTYKKLQNMIGYLIYNKYINEHEKTDDEFMQNIDKIIKQD